MSCAARCSRRSGPPVRPGRRGGPPRAGRPRGAGAGGPLSLGIYRGGSAVEKTRVKKAEPPGPDRALAAIDAAFERHLADLQGYLKVDNVITHRDRSEEMARQLKSEIESLGGQ